MRGAKLSLPLAALLALAAARAAEPAAPAPQKALPDWLALTSAAEARGLYDAAALEWVKAALERPASPGAELALRRLAASRELLASTTPLVRPLEELVRKQGASPVAALLARRLLVGYYREAGRWGDAAKLAAKLGRIESWMAVGAFGRNIAATHDRAFGPERKLDLAAAYDPGRCGALGKLRWRPLPAPLPGEPLEPYKYLRPAGGAVYLLAQVQSEKVRRGCFLAVRTPAAFKLWLNGELLADGDRHREFLPREVVVNGVDLAAGWNRVLLKLSAPAAVSVRLADSGARPLSLPVEKRAVLGPAARPVPPWPEIPPDYPRAEGRIDPRSAPGLAAIGFLKSLGGLGDEAVYYLERAAAADPGRAAWQFLLGEACRGAGHLSPAERGNRCARACRACLKLDAGFAPAQMRLAELELRAGRSERALGLLERASRASPGCYLARLRMAEVAADLGWSNEARTWLAEAQKLRPEFPRCRLLEARLQTESGQLDRAVAGLRELVKAQASKRNYRDLLARTWARRGLWREAVKLRRAAVKLWPRDPEPHLELVRCLTAAGRFREAAEAAGPLLALAPAEADHHQALGEALARGGDRAASLAAYRRALELEAGRHRLRRLLERLGGEDEDFSAPYALDIRKEIEASKKRAHPRAGAVRVLDQTVARVYPDGSAAETVANGERILRVEAIGKLSTQPVLGEFMEARTLRPDGSALEPAVIPGERRLTMPGLEVGATVEYKYRMERPPRPWGGFYLEKWYFRSHGLDQPHQVSDYIVMIPKGLPHKVVRHNFDVPERVEEAGGLLVYRWTARDRPRVHAEPHMPHFDHYLPFVEIGTERSWEDVADSFRSAYLGRTRATRLVARTARRLAAGQGTAAEKARAIYEFVRSHVRHDAPAAGAHQVLAAGAGDREMLFLALAEAAGLEAYQGRTRRAPRFEGKRHAPATWELPSERYLDAELVGVRLADGRIQWMDLSCRMMPFGVLRAQLAGARVLAVGTRGGRAFFERLPEAGFERLGSACDLRLTLELSGRLAGSGSRRVFGSAGAFAKERLLDMEKSARRRLVEAALARSFPGAGLLKHLLPGLEDPQRPLHVALRFERDGHLVPGPGGRLAAPLGLEPLELAPRLAPDATREHPLKLAAPRALRDRLEYRLDPGLEVASLPEGAVLSGKFGTYSLTVRRTAAGFSVERRALVPAQTVAPADYPGFREFCRRLDEAERGRIVLRRRAGAGK